MLMWSLYFSRNQLLLICSPLFCICTPVGGQRTEYQVRIHGCTHSGRSNTSLHQSESWFQWQYCNAGIILRSRYFPVCVCAVFFRPRNYWCLKKSFKWLRIFSMWWKPGVKTASLERNTHACTHARPINFMSPCWVPLEKRQSAASQ